MIRGQIAADYVSSSDPERINSVNGLKKYICSLAYPAIGQLKPEMCGTCVSQCRFGKRLLELVRRPENQPKRPGRPKKEG